MLHIRVLKTTNNTCFTTWTFKQTKSPSKNNTPDRNQTLRCKDTITFNTDIWHSDLALWYQLPDRVGNYAQTERGMIHFTLGHPKTDVSRAQLGSALEQVWAWLAPLSPLRKCSHVQQPAPNGHHQVQLCLTWHLWEQVMSLCTTISPCASVHKFGSPHRLATHNRQGEPDRGKTFLLSWKPDEGKKFFHLKAWWGTTFLLSERLTRIFLSPEGLRWDIFHLKAWRTFLSSESLMRDNISFIWKTDKDISFTWRPEMGHFSSESLTDISFIWNPDEGQHFFHLKVWWGTTKIPSESWWGTSFTWKPDRGHFFHLKAWWGTFLSSESLMRDISFIWKPDEGHFFHLIAWWGTVLSSENLLRGQFFHLKAWWRTFLSSESLMKDISFIWKPHKRQQFIHLRRRRASLWQWMVKQRQTNTKLKCSNPISKAHT